LGGKRNSGGSCIVTGRQLEAGLKGGAFIYGSGIRTTVTTSSSRSIFSQGRSDARDDYTRHERGNRQRLHSQRRRSKQIPPGGKVGSAECGDPGMAYTGSYISEWAKESALIELLRDVVPDGIEALDFNLRYADHISTLRYLVRAIQYQRFADDLQHAYLSHEFRGRVLNLSRRLSTDPPFRTA
jgi:hypothetical protein